MLGKLSDEEADGNTQFSGKLLHNALVGIPVYLQKQTIQNNALLLEIPMYVYSQIDTRRPINVHFELSFICKRL